MDIKVLEFLRKHRISVLGVLDSTGNPYSASLHYAHSEDPLTLLFVTEKDSRKCSSLLDNKSHPASLVIGFSEEEFVTLQLQGPIEILTEEKELENAWSTYMKKYPHAEKRKNDPQFVLLQFTPTWWHYSDLKTTPPTKISSET